MTPLVGGPGLHEAAQAAVFLHPAVAPDLLGSLDGFSLELQVFLEAHGYLLPVFLSDPPALHDLDGHVEDDYVLPGVHLE